MCGIAGMIGYRGDGAGEIQKMNERMIHRGPDAGGYFLDENHHVALGHRRLAIVDLSENGAQPMHSPDERYVLVYNGEVYNFRELRKQMESDGERGAWRGGSDTEVILRAFAFYGVEQTLRKMKGMFALALYDRQKGRVTLARDRMGEKPLYYGMVDGCFAFASDIAAIRELSGFHNEIDCRVLPLYFQYGYIPAPYSIYQDIYKLTPGTWLNVDVSTLAREQHSYWDLMQVAKEGEAHPFLGTRAQAADRLEELLKETVRGQMISDVPLGAFLSGGIDSALVVSIMQAVSDIRVRTFTIGFESEKYNEAEHAKAIAAHLRTAHTELYVGKREACEVIAQIAECFGEPFADSSQIPTMLVSRMTREHVTVSLSGDAGDELFCGYNTYRVAEEELRKLKKKYHRLPGGIRHAVGGLCGRFEGKNELLHKAHAYLTMETLEEAHRYIGQEEARTTYLSKVRTRLQDAYFEYPAGFLRDGVANLMLMDALHYLPDDILVKVDRSGMQYSLETRMPLLDRDVIEFAWTLPMDYKFSEGVTKRVMRDVLYRYVPRELMERPKKGFSIPLHEWLKEGELREWARGVLSDGRKQCADIIDVRTADSYWKDYTERGVFSEKLWYILMLEQWMMRSR
ncbi:MAG: asparagine synthase (glutamine-hydrolyzing) [Lachnospiraceae bacterium]|nr:asparagine synthase (glutamine-hydrolyzing) [Lachnospiraceae bacterium]